MLKTQQTCILILFVYISHSEDLASPNSDQIEIRKYYSSNVRLTGAFTSLNGLLVVTEMKGIRWNSIYRWFERRNEPVKKTEKCFRSAFV